MGLITVLNDKRWEIRDVKLVSGIIFCTEAVLSVNYQLCRETQLAILRSSVCSLFGGHQVVYSLG